MRLVVKTAARTVREKLCPANERRIAIADISLRALGQPMGTQYKRDTRNISTAAFGSPNTTITTNNMNTFLIAVILLLVPAVMARADNPGRRRLDYDHTSKSFRFKAQKFAAKLLGCPPLEPEINVTIDCTHKIRKVLNCSEKVPIGTRASFVCPPPSKIDEDYKSIKCVMPGIWSNEIVTCVEDENANPTAPSPTLTTTTKPANNSPTSSTAKTSSSAAVSSATTKTVTSTVPTTLSSGLVEHTTTTATATPDSDDPTTASNAKAAVVGVVTTTKSAVVSTDSTTSSSDSNVTAQSSNNENNGYGVRLNGKHYKVYRKNTTWNEAEKTCVGDGAHLTGISTEAEFKKIQELCKDAICCIGYNDIKVEGIYTSLDGSVVIKPYSVQWFPMQLGSGKSTDDCSQLNFNPDSTKSSVIGLQMISCDEMACRKFVCRK